MSRSDERWHAWILIAYFHVNLNSRFSAAFCQHINISSYLRQRKGNHPHFPVSNGIKIGPSKSEISFSAIKWFYFRINWNLWSQQKVWLKPNQQPSSTLKPLSLIPAWFNWLFLPKMWTINSLKTLRVHLRMKWVSVGLHRIVYESPNKIQYFCRQTIYIRVVTLDQSNIKRGKKQSWNWMELNV